MSCGDGYKMHLSHISLVRTEFHRRNKLTEVCRCKETIVYPSTMINAVLALKLLWKHTQFNHYEMP